MAIAASKVRSVCSASEVALVRASRKPQLEELSPAQLKQNVARARKLLEKWQGLGRDHARARSGKVGFGEADANTQLKAQIFQDTLNAFEARAAKVDKSAAKSSAAGRKSKQQRSVDHRASRAAVRKGMSTVESLLNEPARQKKAAKAVAKKASAAPPIAPAPVAAVEPAKTKPAKKTKPATIAKTKLPPTKARVGGPVMNPAEQRQALTAAKKSRVTRSGKTTRTLGHVVARGKRAQARRDSKN